MQIEMRISEARKNLKFLGQMTDNCRLENKTLEVILYNKTWISHG